MYSFLRRQPIQRPYIYVLPVNPEILNGTYDSQAQTEALQVQNTDAVSLCVVRISHVALYLAERWHRRANAPVAAQPVYTMSWSVLCQEFYNAA